MTTKTFLSKQMFVYAKAFPNFKPDPDIVEVYFLILEDIPDEVLGAAFKDAIATADPRNAPFFPSAGTLRASATKLMTADITKTPALVAWRQVNDLIREFGAHIEGYGRQDFYNRLDPITRETVKVMGLDDYRNSDVDDVVSWRARFCEIYNTYQERAVDDVRMLPESRALRNEIAANGLSNLTKALTSPTVNGSNHR